MEAQKNIRLLDLNEIKAFFSEIGEKPFRAKQVYEWLWKNSAMSFDDMSNLSLDLRNKLKDNFTLPSVKIKTSQISVDKTIKNAFELVDGNIVEGVLIPSKTRMTACISSQVGCSLTCKFCATGKLKRLRNISFDEIVDQVAHIKRQAEENYNRPLTNIVYMGMGEPLLNYKGMMDSIDKITAPDGLAMSPKRITVSTAGIAKMIMKLGDDRVKFNLALSLHAANDKKRDHIMPINEQNSLASLAEALIYFHEKTDSRVTFEYIVFKDFNDSLEDASELAQFSRNIPCKINIIEYNPIDDSGEFEQTTPERLDAFVKFLEDRNIIVNVRRSRGKDIDAACGQLANKH
ncbi:MAG: 23S rRNA (adenine2503-C2)-methyltransferase [Flavobacteriales bacterium]|jgi:23S rRNA (adenine2503-C2)-methyltransferase|tara:strand:- start:2872 stop:3912 length:1041 start_codon:yes stop_codon:yes gene_type:complete